MRDVLSRSLSVEALETRDVPAALLQVIHNSPYAVAATVDVYVNGSKLLDDFAFRTATPFVSVPSGTPLTVQVAGGNSASAAEALFTQTVTLADGKNYIAVAVGDPLSKAAATQFGLSVTDAGRTSAAAGTVDVLAFHGAPDAPTVDVQARGVGTVVNDFSFRQFAAEGYLSLPAADFDLDVTTPDGVVNVRGFDANLTAAGGKSVTVLASGFVAPPAGSKNDFQLLVAFADGTTALLPVLAPTVTGTAGRDVIVASEQAGIVTVSVNGIGKSFLAATNPVIDIDGLAGSDLITAAGLRGVAVNVDGGAGNDIIFGGAKNDVISGGAGDDILFGYGGNDALYGDAGNDVLSGGAGTDTLNGGTGFNILFVDGRDLVRRTRGGLDLVVNG
jgi:Ca2+-binding RTX toxin-like protein